MGELAEILEFLKNLQNEDLNLSPPPLPRGAAAARQGDSRALRAFACSETGRFKKVGRFTSCNKKRALPGMKEAK